MRIGAKTRHIDQVTLLQLLEILKSSSHYIMPFHHPNAILTMIQPKPSQSTNNTTMGPSIIRTMPTNAVQMLDSQVRCKVYTDIMHAMPRHASYKRDEPFFTTTSTRPRPTCSPTIPIPPSHRHSHPSPSIPPSHSSSSPHSSPPDSS